MSLLNQALLASLPERLRPRCSTACAERLDERPNLARCFCDGPSVIFRAALAALKRPPPGVCRAALCRNCAASIDRGKHYCPTCRRLQFELTRDGLPECFDRLKKGVSMLDPSAPYGAVFALPEALAAALNALAKDARVPMSIFKLDRPPPNVPPGEILGFENLSGADLDNVEVFCVVTMPLPQQPPGLVIPQAGNPFSN